MRGSIDYIAGGKGGGGGSSSVTRTPDNLRSKDTVEAILALGEGPWKGLLDGAKSFYVGDTALRNQNGDYNFTTFELKFLPGTDDPEAVKPTLGGQSSNSQVNLTLARNVSATRQTQSGQIDFIDIRFAVQRLFESNDDGTFNAAMVLRIEYKPLSSSTWTKAGGKDMKFSGKTTSVYVKEYRFAVARINEPYDIRITKISANSSETYYGDVAWESFQETVAGAAEYPNTAVIKVVGEATDQFSSIPQWSGIYETRMVRVPLNYDPVARTYYGVWDGTWKIAYTNNPAWCLYDFVMNDRFGIAHYYPEVNLDKYDVYEAAQWCDEMVPNGRGGLQPRYTLNINLTEARSGKELAQYIAGVFNATMYDDLNGSAYLRVDKDDEACHIFTQENVIDGVFEYTYTDIMTRYNDITVTFNNPDLNWEEDRRRVKDDELITKNGTIPLDFIAVGCIDAQEAIRRAQYKLITSNSENCIVQLRTNRRGQFVNPFDVMLICDPDMGYGISGRAKTISSDRQSITLREPIYLEAGISYNISFELSDGSFLITELTDTFKGYNSVLHFQAELPIDVTPDKVVFTLEHPTLIGLPRPFRVTKVEEVDGNPDDYIIEGININRNKWYDSDNVVNSGVIQYSVLPSPFDPPGPTTVGFTERYIKNKKQFQIMVSPIFDHGVYKYYSNDDPFEVWSKLKGTDDPYTRRILYFGDTLVDHPPGVHQFKILGKSYIGGTSRLETTPTYEFNVANPKDPPKNIDWVRINTREVYWGYLNAPADFAGFQVKYHNQVGRTTWNDAIIAHQGLLSATSFYTNLIPPSARVIMVRAIDDFGIPSSQSAIVYRELGDVQATNVVELFRYEDDFTGTKVGCIVDDGALKALDVGTNIYSGVPTAFMYDGGDMYDASYNEMMYYDTFSISVQGNLVFEIDFEGSGYEIQIRNVVEGIWITVPEKMYIEPGDYEFSVRIFGGKLRGIINALAAIIDVEDIAEDVQDIEVTSEGLVNIPLTKNYTVIKTVSVTIQNSGSPLDEAFTYRLLDKNDPSGPLVEILNKDGDRVAGIIDATIKGY